MTFSWKTLLTALATAKGTSDVNLWGTEYSQLATWELWGTDPTKDAFDPCFFSPNCYPYFEHNSQMQRLQGQRHRFKS